MKICIDVRCLSEGRRTGVEEYTLNLLFNLFENDKKNEFVLFFNSWKKSVNFSWVEKYANVSVKRRSFPNKILNLFFWYLGWPKIDKLCGGADIVFMPNIIFGSVSHSAKLVVTIHDLSFERYPEFFSFKRRLWHFIVNPGKICRRADKIIAVSESTKNDLVNIYKINPEKIEVIYSACADSFKVIGRNDEKMIKTKEKYKLPYKFILYLGTIEPRKNISSLIRAFNGLQIEAEKENNQEIKDWKLVIAGEKGWKNKSIFDEIYRSPAKEKIKFVDCVDNGDKKYVYNLASIFAYPSYFEGFGFPPLEAMRCEVPVIASNNSSLPEVVSGAGILIDPDRPNEIKTALKEIILSRELKSFLIECGMERSKKFGWKNTAQKTLEIFQKTKLA